jgi:hypothetical protein
MQAQIWGPIVYIAERPSEFGIVYNFAQSEDKVSGLNFHIT